MIIDMCLTNAHTIRKENDVVNAKSRRGFMSSVIDGLACEWLEVRHKQRLTLNLRQDTVQSLGHVLKLTKTDFVEKAVCSTEPGQPGKCYICLDLIRKETASDALDRKRRKKNLRKLVFLCSTCKFPACKRHRAATTCTQCPEHEE